MENPPKESRKKNHKEDFFHFNKKKMEYKSLLVSTQWRLIEIHQYLRWEIHHLKTKKKKMRKAWKDNTIRDFTKYWKKEPPYAKLEELATKVLHSNLDLQGSSWP